MIEFWLKLWQLIRPYKLRFILGVLCGILNGFADPVVFLTVAFVVGVVFAGMDDPEINKWLAKLPLWAGDAFVQAQHWLAAHTHNSIFALVFVVGLIPLTFLARGIINYLNAYLMNWVALRAVCDLRARLFEHLLNLPLSFLTRSSSGELMSRTAGDVGVLQSMIGSSMVTMIKEPINVIVWILVPLRVDFKLTMVALAAVPFCAIPIAVYNRKVRKAAASIQTEAAHLNRTMHESFTGMRIIKGYNLERAVVERFRENQRKLISQSMRVVRSTESPGPIIEFLGAIGVAAMLLYMHSRSSFAGFFVFVVALIAIYRPLKAVIRLQSDLHRARAASARVFELLATESTLIDPPQPVAFHAANAPILFDNVSFGYGDKLVLRNICLSVEPGQMAALVGRSGSGKTTLTNLLLRFYDPTEGAIRIGGVDLRQAAVRGVRSQMAVVTQEVILFNDTIRHNIALGRPGATDAEIEDAARQAFAHEFIVEKPRGY
jgi:subfamily B ATP-binding cassette protein MsbA